MNFSRHIAGFRLAACITLCAGAFAGEAKPENTAQAEQSKQEAAAEKYGETLARLFEKNPFGSKSADGAKRNAYTQAAGGAQKSALELRSIYCVDGRWFFCVFDSAAKLSYTLELRGKITEKVPYCVDFYDDETNSISISGNLESATLTLKTPDAPTGAAPQAAPLPQTVPNAKTAAKPKTKLKPKN